MIYGDEPSLLRKIFKGKTVLEIGAYKGYSTCIIASVAKFVMSIDTFTCDNIPGIHPQSTLVDWMRNAPDNADFIQGNSQHMSTMARVRKEKYDGLFIDGDHSYYGAISDLTNYIPLMKDGPKVVAMHDYGNPMFTGVMAAAMNAFQRYPDEHVGGLAVWYLS